MNDQVQIPREIAQELLSLAEGNNCTSLAEVLQDALRTCQHDGKCEIGATAEGQPAHGEYECAMCHGIFSFGWTDEEAKAEAEGKGLDVERCGIVCDDCYKKTPWGHEAQPAIADRHPIPEFLRK